MGWKARVLASMAGTVMALTSGTAVAAAAPTLTLFDGRSFRGEHVAGSPSTPVGGITAPLFHYSGDPCEPFGYDAASIAGKVVVMHVPSGCVPEVAVDNAAVGVAFLTSGPTGPPAAPGSTVPGGVRPRRERRHPRLRRTPSPMGTREVDQPRPPPSGPRCFGQEPTISFAGDITGRTIIGTEGDDVIYAGNGDDVIDGRAATTSSAASAAESDANTPGGGNEAALLQDGTASSGADVAGGNVTEAGDVQGAASSAAERQLCWVSDTSLIWTFSASSGSAVIQIR